MAADAVQLRKAVGSGGDVDSLVSTMVRKIKSWRL
jgi:hypothetical protein